MPSTCSHRIGKLPADITLLARAGDWWHVEVSSRVEPAGTWRALLDAGVRVDEIHREGGGLEELYLAATETKEAA